jgi:hypothetical protein
MVQQYRAITEFHFMVQRNNTTLITLLCNANSFGTGERVTRAILGTLCIK